MQTTLSANHLDYTTPQDGTTFQLKANVLILNTMHTLKLGPHWTMEMQMIARSATTLGYLTYKPYFVCNMGIGRPIFGQKGSLKIAAADVFHTVTITNYGQYGFTNLRVKNRYETQTVFLTVSYRFGNETLKRVNARSTALENEQERLQK